MSQEPENLLESDRLDEVLEEAGPPPPVVVVQYGNRARPWLLIVSVTVALSLGGLLAQNWREARRLRVQTLQAKRALERAMEEARAQEIASPPPDRPVLVAMNPLEMQPLPAPTPAGTATSKAPDASGAPPAETPQATPAEKAPGSSPAPAADGPGSATSDPPQVLAQIPEKAQPIPTSISRPTAPAGPPVPAPPPSAPQPDSRSPFETAASAPDSRSPFEELAGGGDEDKAPARADVAAAPASAPGAVNPPVAAGAPARPAEPPLPSLEETERQIREEAAQKEQENDARAAQQREDLRTIRAEERRQFLDELQMILKTYGKKAGPEIERLSQRSGRKEDPKVLARARWLISESRTSPRVKVRQLRAIGVPETVILDYLANGLNRKLGARDGPRSPDEVWIQAAGLLMKYSREALQSADAAEPRGRPTSRPVGAPQPAGGAARPR